jgi:hypothetical protein
MTVFASILDFGGDMRGRPFPICFYTGVPSIQWPGPTSETIDGGARAMRDLLAISDEVGRFLNTPGHFETIFAGREVDLDGIDGDSIDRSWMDAAGKLDLATWFAGAAPGLKVADLKTWLGLVSRWGDVLAGHEGKDFEPTLRFPLSAGVPSYVQIAGWLHWLGARMDLKRRCLSLFVCGDLPNEPGSLTVVARSIEADDFLLSTSRAGALPYLDDASGLESTDGDEEAPGGDSPSDATSGTWADFVGVDAPT